MAVKLTRISVRGEKAVFMQLRGAIQQAALEFKAESVAMRPASSVSVAVIGASVGADASSRFGVYHLQVGERAARSSGGCRGCGRSRG